MNTDIVPFRVAGEMVEIHPDAEALRDWALTVGALIGRVSDEASNAEATEAMRGIKEVLNSAEAARKKIKEPILDLGRRVDAAAKKFSEPLDAEFKRLQRITADYQTEQIARMREIEDARRREAERLERERQEAERKLREEEERKLAEARRKAEEEMRAARTEAARKAAEERARAEKERIEREAAERLKVEAERAEQAQQMLPPPAAPVRAEGQTAKAVWKFEVVNPFDLVRVNPGFVEITPRRDEINRAIAAIVATGAEPKIPGLRIWEEVAVSVRAGRIGSGKLIEV